MAARLQPLELLSIDVVAEIDKLSRSQLDRPERLGAEVVRLLVRAGATAIHLATRGGRLVARGEAAHIDQRLLEALALVFDPNAGLRERHQAVAMVEEQYDLLYLAVLAAAPAAIEVRGSGGATRLEVSRGGVVWQSRREQAIPELVLEVTPACSRRALARELEHACRFAEVAILRDGRRLYGEPAPPDSLLAMELDWPGARVRVGVPRRAELSMIYVVRDEVVTQEVALPPHDGELIVAVVRTAGEVDPELLARARRRLYAELGRRYPRLLASDQRAARRLLVRACQARGDAAWLAEVPLLRQARAAPMSLRQAQEAQRRGVLLLASPEQRAAAERAGDCHVLLADELDRELLRVAGLVVPPLPSGGVSRPRELWRAAGARLTRALSRLTAARRLSPAELTPKERAFAAAVSHELETGAFLLPAECRAPILVELVGRGRLPVDFVVTSQGTRVRLPLRSRAAVALVEALGRVPSSLPLVMTALFGGHDGYARHKARLHASWLQEVGEADRDPLASPPASR